MINFLCFFLIFISLIKWWPEGRQSVPAESDLVGTPGLEQDWALKFDIWATQSGPQAGLKFFIFLKN